MDKLLRYSIICLIGMFIGTIGTIYKDRNLYNSYNELKKANAYKYECLMAADMYITANEHLLEMLDDDKRICFADTYGELDCMDSINIAYAKLDSLYAQEQ